MVPSSWPVSLGQSIVRTHRIPTSSPVLIGADRPVTEWIKPIEGEANTFQMVDVGRPRNVVLRPFYETHDCRYTIFWDKFTEEDWAKRQAEYEAERKRQAELEARTLDAVQPGEMQPERDHNMQGGADECRQACRPRLAPRL